MPRPVSATAHLTAPSGAAANSFTVSYVPGSSTIQSITADELAQLTFTFTMDRYAYDGSIYLLTAMTVPVRCVLSSVNTMASTVVVTITDLDETYGSYAAGGRLLTTQSQAASGRWVAAAHLTAPAGAYIDACEIRARASLAGENVLVEQEQAENRHRALRDALSVLNERERRIFEARRLADDPVTLEDLSSEFAVARERVLRERLDLRQGAVLAGGPGFDPRVERRLVVRVCSGPDHTGQRGDVPALREVQPKPDLLARMVLDIEVR